MKYLRIHNIGIHINFYQNRFINECVRMNFLKFSYRRKDVRTERRSFLWDVEELTFLNVLNNDSLVHESVSQGYNWIRRSKVKNLGSLALKLTLERATKKNQPKKKNCEIYYQNVFNMFFPAAWKVCLLYSRFHFTIHVK
jgi:hypothetical protein